MTIVNKINAYDMSLTPSIDSFYDKWFHTMMVPKTQKEINLFDKFIASSNEGFFRLESNHNHITTSFYFTDKGRDFFKALLDL